jgi:hypothetical protein
VLRGRWILLVLWLVLLTSAHRRSDDLAGSWPSAFSFSAFIQCLCLTARLAHHRPPRPSHWIFLGYAPPPGIPLDSQSLRPAHSHSRVYGYGRAIVAKALRTRSSRRPPAPIMSRPRRRPCDFAML